MLKGLFQKIFLIGKTFAQQHKFNLLSFSEYKT